MNFRTFLKSSFFVTVFLAAGQTFLPASAHAEKSIEASALKAVLGYVLEDDNQAEEKGAEVVTETENGQINLYATMEAIPGRAAELSKLLAGLAKKVRAEPGNIRYYVYQAQDNGTIFYIEESYKNEKAFHDHMETEHGKSFNQDITRLVIGGKSKVIFLKDVA